MSQKNTIKKNNKLNIISDKKFIETYFEYINTGIGYQAKMSAILNLHHSSVSKRVKKMKANGKLPLDSGNTVEEGQLLKGTSTYHFGDKESGKPAQWVKTHVAAEEFLESFKEAVDNIIDRVVPIKPRKAPKDSNKKLLVKYPIADAHIGLLTWHKEVGTDFNLESATELFTSAMKKLVDSVPASEECLILDLGDTIHTDDQSNATKASKHQLDVDGRFDKLFDSALNILIAMIDMALTKHKIVRFRKTRGNHDPDTSIAIGAFVEAYYRNEPRVIVERSPSLFWHYKFGKTLHVSTHGHTTKQATLPEVAAHDCRYCWSEVEFVYIDTGHVHHQQILETRTATCESHNSLTAGDSYNYGAGYRSKRNMKAIIYHKDYGETARNTVDIRMLKTK